MVVLCFLVIPLPQRVRENGGKCRHFCVAGRLQLTPRISAIESLCIRELRARRISLHICQIVVTLILDQLLCEP